MLNAETWLTAEQCLEFGLCDEILKTSEDERKASASQKYAGWMERLRAQAKPPKPPEQFAAQKNNAERLMTLYKSQSKGE